MNLLRFLLISIGFISFGFGISGRVLEEANKDPVSGALVFVNGGNDSTTTDDQGRFNLPILSVKPLISTNGARVLLRNNLLYLDLKESEKISLYVYDSNGRKLNFIDLGLLSKGSHSLPAGDFFPNHNEKVVYLAIQGNKISLVKKIHRNHNQIGMSEPGKHALLKMGAPGNISVQILKLNDTVVSYTQDNQNVGDIVLTYPPRVIGVGAAPVYGSDILFDGSQGITQAESELNSKWQKWSPNGLEWPQTTHHGITFKVVPDPEYSNDPNHWTLQSCCEKIWGYDDLQAKQVHGDIQIHVEFIFLGEYDNDNNPSDNENNSKTEIPRGPGYNNSGVYVQSRYEVQLRSLQENRDPLHGMASMVDEYAPSTISPMKPNGIWQAYDITFRTSRWNGNSKSEDAYMTVYWNGVKVHDNKRSTGPATGLSGHSGEPVNSTLFGLKLQSEGSDVRFRNIWIKKLNLELPQTNLGY